VCPSPVFAAAWSSLCIESFLSARIPHNPEVQILDRPGQAASDARWAPRAGDQLVAPFGQPVLPEARESILAGLVLGDAYLDHPAVGSGASGKSQRKCESVGRIGPRMDVMGIAALYVADLAVEIVDGPVGHRCCNGSPESRPRGWHLG